jgi:hypothetical protein
VSALGAVAAALVAVFTLRAQQRMQIQQHNLDNYWRITDGWWALRSDRAIAARSLLAGTPSHNHVVLVLNYLERMSHLARTGEISVELVRHGLGVTAAVYWSAAHDLIRHWRVELGNDGAYEDLEWLQPQLGALSEDFVRSFLERQASDRPAPVPVIFVQE